jgi:molybdopterin-biosynthesis enzyme MoeA-like protein
MLDDIAPKLSTGARMQIETIDAQGTAEGIYAAGLGEIALAHPTVSIGSYPSFQQGSFRNQIVVRGKDAEAVAAAAGAVRLLLLQLVADRAPL